MLRASYSMKMEMQKKTWNEKQDKKNNLIPCCELHPYRAYRSDILSFLFHSFRRRVSLKNKLAYVVGYQKLFNKMFNRSGMFFISCESGVII